MDGDVIQTRRLTPLPPIVLALAAVAALAFGGLQRNLSWLRIAFVPPLAASAVAAIPRRRFECRITDSALEVIRPRPRRVEFRDVFALALVPRSSSSAKRSRLPDSIVLHHPNDTLVIPDGLNRPLWQIVEFIASRIGFGGYQAVHPPLEAHLKHELETFGADKVYCFSSIGALAKRRMRPILWFGLSLMASAAVMAILENTFWPRDDYAIPTAVTWSLVGFLFMMIGLIRHGQMPSAWRTSCLVVSPSGIALSQGAVLGKLNWAELRTVKFAPIANSKGSFGYVRGLALIVEGATIGIADIYSRPIQFIERLINLYWRGAATCLGCGRELTIAQGPGCQTCVGAIAAAAGTLARPAAYAPNAADPSVGQPI